MFWELINGFIIGWCSGSRAASVRKFATTEGEETSQDVLKVG